VLGDCFMAFRGPVDEDLDSYIAARVGAVRFAEFVNGWFAANTKR
jgi:hypothetical protein